MAGVGMYAVAACRNTCVDMGQGDVHDVTPSATINWAPAITAMAIPDPADGRSAAADREATAASDGVLTKSSRKVPVDSVHHLGGRGLAWGRDVGQFRR